jgi:predicted MFS family arabinose efflux permease
VNGVSYIAVIIGLLLMRLPAFVRPEQAQPALGQVGEAIAYIRQHSLTSALITLTVITSLVGWPYQVLMPIYAGNVLRVGQWGYGRLLSANGIGALLGALTVSLLAHRPHKGRLLYVTVPVFAVSVLAFAWSRWLPLSCAMLIVTGWTLMMQFATANTLIQTHVPDALRGRVLSVYILAFSGLMPFGSLQIGQIAHRLGPPAIGAPRALTFNALAFGVLALTLLIGRRDVLVSEEDARRQAPDTPGETEAAAGWVRRAEADD